MTKSRGINVPDDPNCLEQEYLDSRVIEYYETEALRDARVGQLQGLGRTGLIPFFARVTKSGRHPRTWAVRWQEPRGEALDAIRAGS